jgi:hypothetical protein
MITDEYPCQSIDNDYRGLLAAYQMDNMEWPPCPECGDDHAGECA